MTSQIAIFNLECVAVASDSVMTVQRGSNRKTISSSEKLFGLGKAHRLILMTNGESRFMRIPWGVLVPEWRRTLDAPLDTVDDYARHFIEWLTTPGELFSASVQEQHFLWMVRDYFLAVRQSILRDLEDAGLTDEPWDAPSVASIVDAACSRHLDLLTRKEELPGIDPDADAKYVQESAALIHEEFDYVFDDVPRTVHGDEILLRELPLLLLTRDEPWGYDTTMAFIGFGESDVFPAHRTVDFHGLVNGAVRASWRERGGVTPSSTSLITPFGQTEAINTFLRAYNHDFLWETHQTIDSVLDKHDGELGEGEGLRESLHTSIEDAFSNLSWNQFISPMLSTVDALPKPDLARMAESLVGVQALRAASMDDMPTVGGPIDVVVITRDAGVEWLRRKQAALD